MKVAEVLEILNSISPFELQESWDNSGLQVGSLDAEIKQIVVSLDFDKELLEVLEPNTLLITHHPLIFKPLKSINYDEYPALFIQTMIQKNIAHIAMHTNFDQTHLNRYVLEEILGYSIYEQEGYIAYFETNTTLHDLAYSLKEKLQLPSLKIVAAKERIEKVAFCTGSGASMLSQIKADCFLTGDIKYHDAMLAQAVGISMIDIGHYESECFFSKILAKELKNFKIEAIISQSKNPFSYM